MVEYRGSLNAKITASIVWVFIFFGIFITTVVLLNMRDDLASNYARDARLLTLLIEQEAATAGQPEALIDSIKNRLLPEFGIPKLEIRFNRDAPLDIVIPGAGSHSELVAMGRTRSISYRGTDGGDITLELKFFHPPFHQIINARRTEIIMKFGLPLLGIATLLFYITHRVVTRPLLQVVSAIGKVAAGDMKQRVDIKRNDELGTLADFFNSMLDKLGKKQEALKYEVRKHNKARREITQFSEELRQANHELTTFSYTVSHDLRAPLRAIRGFSGALQEDHEAALGDEGKLLLDRIGKAGESMENLINDILDMSRASRQEMVLCSVDIANAAEEILQQLTFGQQGGHAVELDIETPLKATADPSLMHIALVNLLGNACKYSSKSDHPRISVGRAPDEDDQDCFYIKDNGSGFDMKFADKLFVPFQRLHNSTDFEGTGIGLATVKRIIERHHGRIWAVASPGNGACFYFSLPKQPLP